MALTLYGFHDYPTAFAVTKIDAPLEDCTFLLDFQRPLRKVRSFGRPNFWIGRVIALAVPVVHVGEDVGGYIIIVNRDDGYFDNILALWKQHRGTPRVLRTKTDGGIQIAADFGTHFPQDC